MKRFWFVLLPLLVACQHEEGVHQAWLSEIPAEVEFGAPFEVELLRQWPEGWQPDAWSTSNFAPFEVEVLQEERATQAEHIVVRRRLRLRAFDPAAQTQVFFAARNPDQSGQVQAPVLSLLPRVVSSLQPGASMDVELPPALGALSTEASTRAWIALAGIALALFASWFLGRARGRQATSSLPGPKLRLWQRFRAIQELPRETPEQRRQALAEARALVRALESNPAWAGPELAQRLAQRFSLPPTESSSLRHVLDETESAAFSDPASAPPQLDPTWDELAEVLRAVDPEEQR